jgi:hypothetical protein
MITFFLTVGSTLAVGSYGIISAIYLEVLKENFERSGGVIATLIVCLLIITYSTIWCFREAYLLAKRDLDQCA